MEIGFEDRRMATAGASTDVRRIRMDPIRDAVADSVERCRA